MRIKLTKRGRRNQMRCFRTDGTSDVADLGPGLPHHDLAHFVVEREWNLREGFYGNLANGYTFAQLSDKNVITSLGPESAQAEVLARALQSLSTGACTADEFGELVRTELDRWKIPAVPVPSAKVQSGDTQFKHLLDRFNALGDGESLELEFEHSARARRVSAR